VDQRHVLVSFYTEPNDVFSELEKAAAQMAALGFNPPVIFAQVNLKQNRQLASKFNISNSSLIWFVGAQPQLYAGISLQSDDIFFWVLSQVDTFTTSLTQQVTLSAHPLSLQTPNFFINDQHVEITTFNFHSERNFASCIHELHACISCAFALSSSSNAPLLSELRSSCWQQPVRACVFLRALVPLVQNLLS
jgi:hypothetical protein